MRPQIILGVTITFQRSHIHVSLAGKLSAYNVSRSNEGIEQIAEEFIAMMAGVP